MSNLRRRAVSILMVVAMALALFSCSSPSDKEKFIGTWKAAIDVTDTVTEGLAQEGGEIADYINLGKFEFVLLFTFNEDGTYSMSADENSLNDSIENVKVALKDGLTKYCEEMIADTGLDMSVDDVLMLSTGMSMDEMIEEGFSDDLFSGAIEEIESSGKWNAEDGKLYISDSMAGDIDETSYVPYEITSNEIKLAKPEGFEDDLGMFPMVLTKVN